MGLLRRTTLGLAALIAMASTGCGESIDEAPAVCLDGRRAYLVALRDAPGQVRLGGETPISDCLVENQGGGELATVGVGMVEAATRLNAEGRANPDGPAPLRLGYLIGAAEAGTDETAGIHTDLIRRLQTAARYGPADRPLPARFLAAYREGLQAGLARG
jgi:hypothetical protein